MRKADRCEVVAVGSRDVAAARSFAEELGIPRAHGSYEALLADPEVDAVYIPLPNHLHLQWTIAAARAGKHVLCEKPLALTAADAERMVEACEREGVRLMEAFMYRLHPSWQPSASSSRPGASGALVAVQSWFSYFNDDPTNIRNIRDAGGGALCDIGCYSVNLSRMFLGDEPTRVQASIVRDPVMGVDVVTSAMLDFPGGANRNLHLLDARGVRPAGPHRRHRGPDLDRDPVQHPTRPSDRGVRHEGRRPARRAGHRDARRSDCRPIHRRGRGVRRASILDGLPTPTPPSDAVANLRVIEAIFAAAEAGVPIDATSRTETSSVA